MKQASFGLEAGALAAARFPSTLAFMASRPGRRNPRTPPTANPPVAGNPGADPFPAADPAGPASAPESPLPPRWRQALLAAVWCYVAALWLLALDQTFSWGIFGPAAPPTP